MGVVQPYEDHCLVGDHVLHHLPVVFRYWDITGVEEEYWGQDLDLVGIVQDPVGSSNNLQIMSESATSKL